MCTAISYKTANHYFGRNLDLEYSYGESVIITPRNYPLHFSYAGSNQNHYAIIGIGTVMNDYPLYYDATNECGLSMAGLNFPGNAVFPQPRDCIVNIAPFEFLPWVLSKFNSVNDVKTALKNINVADIAFSSELPPSPLHWLISDKNESIVVEPMADGLRIFDNPIGILTNNPTFDFHMLNLCNYINLTHEQPVNRFCSNVDIMPYSRGMGAIGLPGDLSSSSRFIRAAFTKLNSICDESDDDSISQFFHILTSVEQQRGCVSVGDKFEITLYSSCCNTDKGIYYYTSYDNRQITAVYLHHEDLSGEKIIPYPLITKQQIRTQN